jgi:hypothetical protein
VLHDLRPAAIRLFRDGFGRLICINTDGGDFLPAAT